MSEKLKWTDRTFAFTFPVEVYPEMIERVRGTPARLEDRVKALPVNILTKRDGERWSIHENAGHLLDLESLVRLRLEQYLTSAKELHAADMSNRRTYGADHNQAPTESILKDFRQQRTQLVGRLENMSQPM